MPHASRVERDHHCLLSALRRKGCHVRMVIRPTRCCQLTPIVYYCRANPLGMLDTAASKPDRQRVKRAPLSSATLALCMPSPVTVATPVPTSGPIVSASPNICPPKAQCRSGMVLAPNPHLRARAACPRPHLQHGHTSRHVVCGQNASRHTGHKKTRAAIVEQASSRANDPIAALIGPTSALPALLKHDTAILYPLRQAVWLLHTAPHARRGSA